jgi:hypothetical protein
LRKLGSILRLLAVSIAAGVVGATVLLISDTGSLAAGGGAVTVILVTAAVGAIVGGPYALLCGGLLRWCIWRSAANKWTTILFPLAGGLAGGVILPLAWLFTAEPLATLPGAFVLTTILAGIVAALAFRLIMSPLSNASAGVR